VEERYASGGVRGRQAAPGLPRREVIPAILASADRGMSLDAEPFRALADPS
jgi:hypothetical protein